MKRIEPEHVRYIKLGAGGRWAKHALENHELPFDYRRVPHELCTRGDWQAVTQFLRDVEAKDAGKASDACRELRDFYTLGEDCLWITFVDGHLWWCFARPEVIWRGGDGEELAVRFRRTAAPWRNTDLNGTPLRMDQLSTKLTQVAAYRQTLCSVAAEPYLLRRIRGEEEPMLARARSARAEALAAADEMIAGLHWADFETLADLLFARMGWQRVSRVGGTQKDVDLVIEQPATGEKAFVQVKSRADQSVLDEYIQVFEWSGIYDRMFFVCHTPVGTLGTGERPNLHVWTRKRLAESAVDAGLFDWLMEKSA